MKDLKLTKEEKDLLESFERGEWRSVLTPQRRREIEEVSRNTPSDYHGGESDYLYLKGTVINKLKSKAKKRGISYQDLASSILQKFANS